uniref:Uncharacterized protein n=1 Tax=Rangifer tarandus platyrhynchus TaxID=3082113 RepID=A0ACB0EAT6_RANTA|nr:unnamed protein product [Rangifer tarandus platyrhynchus]
MTVPPPQRWTVSSKPAAAGWVPESGSHPQFRGGSSCLALSSAQTPWDSGEPRGRPGHVATCGNSNGIARGDERQPPYGQSGGSCRAIKAGTRASVAFTRGSDSACEHRAHAAVGGLAVRKGDPVTNGSGVSSAPRKRPRQPGTKRGRGRVPPDESEGADVKSVSTQEPLGRAVQRTPWAEARGLAGLALLRRPHPSHARPPAVREEGAGVNRSLRRKGSHEATPRPSTGRLHPQETLGST